MTQAILPLNVRALRVNQNDAQLLTGQFKGRVARFEHMPFSSTEQRASTGEQIVQPLESTAPALESLPPGIHLHWELPDAYKRGVQGPEGGDPVFPAAPNFWLVIRYLQIFDATAGAYGPVSEQAFIVESDYISAAAQLEPDPWGVTRPAISVPLPANPPPHTAPYRFMGRVCDYGSWTGPAAGAQYLSDFAPNYLTSIGFVGPSFSAYYPECKSVFGFWDHFKDQSEIYNAIVGNTPIQFRASYQVIGWVGDASKDLFAGFGAAVTQAYDDYVAKAQAQQASIAITPASQLDQMAQQQWRLAFNPQDIAFTLNADQTIATLDAPDQGLCAGIAQELVWDMLNAPGTRYFLGADTANLPSAVWTDDEIRVAVGNSAIEGLSALIKGEVAVPNATPAQLSDVETLLDALQLGLLHDLEASGSSLITLDETLHSRGFARQFGGYVWSIVKSGQSTIDDSAEVDLPLPLAELLFLLNQAQKSYDQGRAELDTLRRQLFMDWLRYVAPYVAQKQPSPTVTTNLLTTFLDNGSESELGYVTARGAAIGTIDYQLDAQSGTITGLQAPPAGEDGSLATALYAAWQAVSAALPTGVGWTLQATPETPFWAPTDPVLVIQGDRIEPVRRNGDAPCTPVRLREELLDTLQLSAGGAQFTLGAGAIAGPPTITAATPCQATVQALAAEGALLIPMLAGSVASAVAALGGAGNPAATDAASFATALNVAQGGASPLDPALPTGQPTSLYDQLQATGASPILNPAQSVTAPIALTLTFTNAAGKGWTPYGTAITAQSLLPEFSATRADPFLPVFLVWEATLDPLSQSSGGYAPDTLTRYFALDEDDVDYVYAAGTSFTTGTPVTYRGSVVLSRQTTRSLTAQIDQYEKLYPKDPANPTLDQARAFYSQANIMSQGIDGFSQQMLLQSSLARVTVQDLPKGGQDAVTTAIAAAALADPNDNWYQYAFNNSAAIPFDQRAQDNFGPLRAGFSDVRNLEIVDAFGQRLTLQTSATLPSGAQEVIPAFPLTPVAGGASGQGALYLPPRLIPPSRVWFKWLSASFDPSVPGITDDFVETNSHPATSPICGVVLPNHLDMSLMFYQASGEAIGSFGVEHGTLKYRTRPGNEDNAGDDLATDIGPVDGPPTVNDHLHDVMWHIAQQSAGFLADLMAAIQGSEGFLNPANYAQSVDLAVLMGQPLVIARAVLGVETSGGLLPVSQADTSSSPDFSNDVNAGRYRYPDRQAAGAAGLAALQIPLQLGNLANIDDGMIGYFIDGQGQSGPYGTFYAPAAKAGGANGVVPPDPTTLAVTLNAAPTPVTFLLDPRAPIHATSGILPVQQSAIPPEGYAAAFAALQISFVTRPVLAPASGLTLPLPSEPGYVWSWVQTGQKDQTPLAANAGTDAARFGFTPQQLLEGWTQLQKAPPPPAAPTPTPPPTPSNG